MDVELLRGTENPEQLVTTAARNDYRSEGVIDYTYDEIMSNASIDSEFEDENETMAKRKTLLKHLMNSEHWGVFEHPSATIALEGVTRVAMAQITRHRHFTFDIMSLRYVDVSDESVEDRFQIPEPVKENRSISRDGVKEISDDAEQVYINAYENAIETYRTLIEQKNVPPEEARKVLPMGIKVNIVMSGNARAWMHLLNIRGKANVQHEARELSDQIFDELVDWMPYTFTRFDEKLPMNLTP